jgi:hypothetical protein
MLGVYVQSFGVKFKSFRSFVLSFKRRIKPDKDRVITNYSPLIAMLR